MPRTPNGKGKREVMSVYTDQITLRFFFSEWRRTCNKTVKFFPNH